MTPDGSSARRAAVAAAAAALVVACSGGTMRVETLRVSDGGNADALREAGLDRPGLEAAIRDGVAAAGFRVGEGRGRAFRAAATVRALGIVAGGPAPRAEVVVDVELDPVDGGGAVRRETGTGSVAVESGALADAFRRATVSAARHAAAGLALALAESRKGEAQLLADLRSTDVRVRAQAVRTLGERRSRPAVPALVERLHDEDSDVVHATVGALVRIGDERAVGPLIALSRRGDPALTARMARFIGDVGGSEAEGYLLTLESGHPDPRVRRAARDALREMDERAADARAAAPPARP